MYRMKTYVDLAQKIAKEPRGNILRIRKLKVLRISVKIRNMKRASAVLDNGER